MTIYWHVCFPMGRWRDGAQGHVGGAPVLSRRQIDGQSSISLVVRRAPSPYFPPSFRWACQPFVNAGVPKVARAPRVNAKCRSVPSGSMVRWFNGSVGVCALN